MNYTKEIFEIRHYCKQPFASQSKSVHGLYLTYIPYLNMSGVAHMRFSDCLAWDYNSKYIFFILTLES